MIEANNVIIGRRVVVIAIYLRDAAANWYKVDKENIT